MIEAGAFMIETLLDESLNLFGKLFLSEGFVFVIFQDADAIEVDVRAFQRETLEDAVGVLNGEDDDGAFGLIGHRERAGMERKDFGIREVLIPGAFRGDADGAGPLGDVIAGLFDEPSAGKDIVLIDE